MNFLAHVSQADPRSNWAPIVLMIIIGLGFSATNILASLIIGPSRSGPGKETTYESGMMPIGDARRRFNVRFYVVAMIFLVFDVDIIFLYPWATIYAPAAQAPTGHPGLDSGKLLLDVIVFVVLLLVAYFYAWGKGVFRWD